MFDKVEEYFSPNIALKNQSASEGAVDHTKLGAIPKPQRKLSARVTDKQKDKVLQDQDKDQNQFQKPGTPPPIKKRQWKKKEFRNLSPIKSRSSSQKRKNEDLSGLGLGQCTCVEYPDFVCPLYEHNLPPSPSGGETETDCESNLSNCDSDGFITVGKNGRERKKVSKKQKKSTPPNKQRRKETPQAKKEQSSSKTDHSSSKKKQNGQ